LSDEQRMYELPDDKGIITVDHRTRFNASEILFRPELCGIKSNGIAQLAFDSIEKCDQDLRIVIRHLTL
jgi:hypothetical protein